MSLAPRHPETFVPRPSRLIPALANAAAGGEMAARRALDASAAPRAAAAAFARRRPWAMLALAGLAGLMLAGATAPRPRPPGHRRLARHRLR